MTDTQQFRRAPFVRPPQGLCAVAEAAWMIQQGRVLLLAGAEDDLSRLPEGCWIGGTAGHFATPAGCVPARGQVFFTDFSDLALSARWRQFTAETIGELARHYPDNGFAILLLPGFSRLLGHVAPHIMEFEGLYNLPLTGWVSAVGLDYATPLPAARPKVFAGGPRGEEEQAVVLYITLGAEYFAQLQIANLFTPGEGADIRFLHGGQSSEGDCLIGGERANLARYIEAQGLDRRLPLVADHDGALLNAAILQADAQSGKTIFLAPVSPALTYRFAAEVVDYEAEFARAAAEIELEQAAHGCICVLHYHYTGLTQGRQAGFDITAPITFGQIAYTVLNQTLTCLTISRYEDEWDIDP